jgi:hypothetical protein
MRGSKTYETQDASVGGGGTALVARGKLVHNIGKRGVDEAGLGRWCWLQFVSKNNKSTRIISVYAPQLRGAESVGSQHRRYYNSIGCDANPVDAFWTYLSGLIRKWTELSESSVLLTDWNEDVKGEKTRKYMADLDMREVITEFHGNEGPRAYNRGSNPIDGILVTQDLYIVQDGYMPFGMDIGSDHRCLWLDIQTRVLMGQDLEQPRKFAAQRLKCDDPRARNKYIAHYEQYIEKKQLCERSRKLTAYAKELGLTQKQAQEYEQLDALRKKGVYEAQQQCMKFRTGEKDWTPKHTILGVRVLFWKSACNRAYGAKVQRRNHTRLRTKALLQNVIIQDTTAGIVAKIKEAMAKWRKYSKAEAEEDRKTFLQKKAMAIVEEKNTMMEKITNQLRLREDQKRSATQIKIVRGKLRSGGVSKVTYLDKNQVTHE